MGPLHDVTSRDVRFVEGHASVVLSVSTTPLSLLEGVAATPFFCLSPHHSIRLDCCGGAFFPGGIVMNFADSRQRKGIGRGGERTKGLLPLHINGRGNQVAHFNASRDDRKHMKRTRDAESS